MCLKLLGLLSTAIFINENTDLCHAMFNSHPLNPEDEEAHIFNDLLKKELSSWAHSKGIRSR